ncbi:DNA-methyltransferase [Nocardia elegans]|uniref:Methyltransferase n=1 Tax=Nocardia elegans TaxID=300029 RepID=A0ABW6TLI5_9NOCA
MVQPFYSDDLVSLYHGDCLELADLWTGADVLICDPPYGISYQSNKPKSGPTKAIAGDDTVSIRDAVLDLWGDKSAAVFGSWRKPRPIGARNLVVWDKSDSGFPGMGDLHSIFGNSHEEIYIFGRWLRGERKRRPSVVRTRTSMASLSTKVGHPTPKPIELMELLIEVAPPGVIADPFAGSGSTLIAARAQGRRAIGIELDETYCRIAAERLAATLPDADGLPAAA